MKMSIPPFTDLYPFVCFFCMQIFHTAPDPSIPLPQPQSRSGSRRTRAICLSTGSRKPRGRYTPCLAEPDSKCDRFREKLSSFFDLALLHLFDNQGRNKQKMILMILSPKHPPPTFIYSLSVQLQGTLNKQIHYYYKGKKNSLLSALFSATVIKNIRYYFVAGFVLLLKRQRRKQEKFWLKPSVSFFLPHYVLKASSLGYQSV